MEAFDEIKDKLRQSMVGKFPVEIVSEVESIICVTLGRYDIKEKETGLVVYDAGDTEIVQKFFLAKATHALRNGMPIDQVRLMLGHEDIATTTIYAQTHTDDVKRAHEKFV